MSDSDLDLQAGDGLFVQLLARHEPEIRAYIRASLPSPHHVAEVMQDVSLVAWKKFGDLSDPSAEFARWVCVIARYEIMKFRRGLARDRLVLNDELVQRICEEGELEVSSRSMQMTHLEACLDSLPRSRREFVLAAYRPGITIRTLAEQQGKKPDALYQLLKRLRLKLAMCIQERVAAGL